MQGQSRGDLRLHGGSRDPGVPDFIPCGFPADVPYWRRHQTARAGSPPSGGPRCAGGPSWPRTRGRSWRLRWPARRPTRGTSTSTTATRATTTLPIPTMFVACAEDGMTATASGETWCNVERVADAARLCSKRKGHHQRSPCACAGMRFAPGRRCACCQGGGIASRGHSNHRRRRKRPCLDRRRCRRFCHISACDPHPHYRRHPPGHPVGTSTLVALASHRRLI